MENGTNILNQLGGNKFLFMTGAKNLIWNEEAQALSFKFPTASKKNYCKITLNSLDTYDIEFGKIYGGNYTVVSEFKGYYNDMLRELFTKETGLYTSL